MFFCCECCVLSCRGHCDEPIARSDGYYRLLYVVCDLETSRLRRPWPALGSSATRNNNSCVCPEENVSTLGVPVA